MKGVNKVILLGTCGKDPETRYSTDGKTAFTSVSIATSEQWKDKNTGEKKEATEWHNLSFAGRIAEIAGEYLKKGSKVYVEGKIKTRKWQDSNGQDRYTTEIHCHEMQLLDSSAGKQEKPASKAAPIPADFDDSIIPF